MRQTEFRTEMLAKLREITGTDDVPPVFVVADNPRPLKIGAREDLIARYPQAKPWKITRWLGTWRRRFQYCRAVAIGAVRFDLDSRPAGRIGEDERAAAREAMALTRKPKPKTVGKCGRPILHIAGRRDAAPRPIENRGNTPSTHSRGSKQTTPT